MANPIIDQAAKRVEANMKQNQKKKGLPKPRTITEVSAERIRERTQEALAPSTGYPELDKIIRGFIPGHLYTLTGDTNVGKTTLACNFAVRIARQNNKVLYFALEPENTVVDYLASVKQNKRFDELTHDDIQDDSGHIFIYGKEEVKTLDDMVNIIDVSDETYDLIIIDHVGYFLSGGKNWLQEQSNAVKKLAGLAKRKKVAIMIIAHLRKKSSSQKKDYMPTSDDIAGSGAFKQDSTEVVIVTRDLLDAENSTMEYGSTGYINVMKTKCGPNGRVRINFQEMKANIFSDGELQHRMNMSGSFNRGDNEWQDNVKDALF